MRIVVIQRLVLPLYVRAHVHVGTVHMMGSASLSIDMHIIVIK